MSKGTHSVDFMLNIQIFSYWNLKKNQFIDMRNTKLLEAFLQAIEGFSETDPTFILSEVVLTYMAVNR